jgi:transposase
MAAKPEVLELDVQKLSMLLEKIRAGLGEDVASPFGELLEGYQTLLGIIARKEITLAKLRQIVFGAKTERTRDVLGPDRAASGDDAANAPDAPAGESVALVSVVSTLEEEIADGQVGEQGCASGRRPRRGHGRHAAQEYSGCAKVIVSHPWLHVGDPCPHCGNGKVYEQDDPGRVIRLVGQAPVGGTVYELQRLRCHLCGDVFTAERPEGIGDQKYDPSAVSMMAMMRYGLGMALNRSATLQQSMGIPLAASTQWEVVSSHADTVVPVYQHLAFQAAQGDVVYHDDTTGRILELRDPTIRREALGDDDPDRCGVFTTCVLSTGNGHSIALYFTGPRHAGENLRELLLRRSEGLPPPIQMCDALSRNMPADLRTILANCLSHGRRRFVEVVDAFPPEVAYVLGALKQVYKIDAEAKQQQLSADERLGLHQQRSGPVMEALHQWLTDQFQQRKTEPNSSLGEAITYMLKHWQKLTLFLRQPGAPLDNNLCEQALKKSILHRKNSLFYKTRRGAFVGDLYMSFIQTCFLCRIDPFDYLTQLLRNPQQAAQAPEQWMPWNYQASLAMARASPLPCGETPSPATP